MSEDSGEYGNEDDSEEYLLELSFYIDTDAYTERDRNMFVAGYEFGQVIQLIRDGWRGERPVHAENESRLRMSIGQLRIPNLVHELKGYDETWSFLSVKEIPQTGSYDANT